VVERGGRVYLNGAYRHGFLLAPNMARQAVETANMLVD
jgi:glycine/D-amino acid oxidase-like deaminating enzyme